MNLPIAAPVAVALATTLVLAGCTSTTTGDATTATRDGVASSPVNTTASGTTAPADNWWQEINSCDLLGRSAATQLGFTTPGHVYIHSEAENSCSWDSTSASLQIVLTRQRYDDLTPNGGNISGLTVANRPAKLDAGSGGPGGCDLSIEATNHSRALIIAITNFSTDEACQTAKSIAEAIASQLPSTGG